MEEATFAPNAVEWIFFATAVAATVPMIWLLRWILRELKNETGAPPPRP